MVHFLTGGRREKVLVCNVVKVKSYHLEVWGRRRVIGEKRNCSGKGGGHTIRDRFTSPRWRLYWGREKGVLSGNSGNIIFGKHLTGSWPSVAPLVGPLKAWGGDP